MEGVGRGPALSPPPRPQRNGRPQRAPPRRSLRPLCRGSRLAPLTDGRAGRVSDLHGAVPRCADGRVRRCPPCRAARRPHRALEEDPADVRARGAPSGGPHDFWDTATPAWHRGTPSSGSRRPARRDRRPSEAGEHGGAWDPGALGGPPGSPRGRRGGSGASRRVAMWRGPGPRGLSDFPTPTHMGAPSGSGAPAGRRGSPLLRPLPLLSRPTDVVFL